MGAELHEINGKWYFYFAADNGSNANHRMYVVENSSPIPVEGTWEFKEQVADATNQWAIERYHTKSTTVSYICLWSGGNAGAAPQNIYIARMSNPGLFPAKR